MAEDRIQELVDEAYTYFSDTTIFEVIDLERPAAIQKMQKLYRCADPIRVNKYLDVLDQLNMVIEGN